MVHKTAFIGFGIALPIIIASAFFFYGKEIFWFIFIIALFLAILPLVISFLLEQKKQKEKEEKFLEFSRDLVENVKSGTPVSKSILNLKDRDYGALSGHIKKMANQLSLGIPLTKSLLIFAKETKSNTISRAINLISEAEKRGGQIESIIESVSNSVGQVEQLKAERKSGVYNLVVQGYIIFLVFIVIMLVLEFFILPMTTDLGTMEGSGLGRDRDAGMELDEEDFAAPLFIMIIVQSFFAGLVIGKVSEGTIKAGIKHSFILLFITLIVITGARALFG